ncbi:IS200/IS605 family transposase [Pasteurella sp. PK-2025]|uniref:IS200/IS605 family transposase n=1 Tax=unclassified Pasteurella TaxID=2621516 RepID=UPI003C7884B7
MSYTRLLYHIIFRTKYGEPSITEQYEADLYRCIWKFTQDHHCILHRVNGMPDHIHLFVDIHQSIAVAEFMRKLKKTTHLFLESHPDKFPHFHAWSVGYCALTYSEHEKEKIINYIKKQKEHHKTANFKDEIKQLFIENKIQFDDTFFERNL